MTHIHRVQSLIALLLAASVSLASEAPAEPRSVLGGKLTMAFPAGLTAMSEAAKQRKYPGPNAPTHALTDPSGSVNLVYDHKLVPLKPSELPAMEDGMREQFAEAQVNALGIRKLNGTDFLLIDAEVSTPEGDIRNFIAMTSLEGRLLVVSYNCVVSKVPDCAAQGRRVIDSLTVKPGS